jgi:uncharacterized protein YbjT (DUF2867 family)
MARTILITGATGKVSTDLIQSLQGSKHKLRVLVRDEAKGARFKAQGGVEVFVGDLDRPRTLAPAFAGVDSLWLLTSPGPRAPDQNSSAIWAARRAGVSHIVRMSAVGAAHNAPTINSRSHALSDTELSLSGIPFTILKPHFFMQNLMMGAQAVAKEGALYIALGEGRMGLIDARDIGLFAAQVLTTGGHEGKTYTPTGPASIDMATAAAQLGAALGKPVRYVPISMEQMVQNASGLGMDDWMITSLVDYFTAYSNQWGDFVTDDFQRVTGKAPRTFATFARDFAGAFGK